MVFFLQWAIYLAYLQKQHEISPPQIKIIFLTLLYMYIVLHNHVKLYKYMYLHLHCYIKPRQII
jgi:hypothetical protein